MTKKTETVDLLGFFSIHSVAKHQKIEGGPFEEFFFKKSIAKPKKLKGGHFSLFRIVCYAEKEEKPFWFSSLDQMIQFETIKVRITILVSSCGLKKSL